MAIKDHPNYAALATLTQSLITNVKNKQAEYFTKTGKYFQGLKIPAIGKADGKVLMDIAYGLHPSDQDASWYTFDAANFNVDAKLPCHIRIDVYQSPKGWGWMLTIEFFYPGLGPDAYGTEGDYWVYQHNDGPEHYQGVWDEWYIKLVIEEPV